MALIKIRGRKEPITVDNARGRQIKTLRFGDAAGNGKADPHDDLDLGDEWAGMLGQVEWIQLELAPQPKKFKVIRVVGDDTKVYQVPVDYKLKEGEELA